MLWTEITKVVTRDGKTLVGAQVREWLKERGVLPPGYVGASIAIESDPAHGVLLRTRAEVRADLIKAEKDGTIPTFHG